MTLMIYRSTGWVFLECLPFRTCLNFFLSWLTWSIVMRHEGYRSKEPLASFHAKVGYCDHWSSLWISITFIVIDTLVENITMKVWSPHQKVRSCASSWKVDYVHKLLRILPKGTLLLFSSYLFIQPQPLNCVSVILHDKYIFIL